MKLKKINAHLQQALVNNGFENPTTLQKESFGAIKSGGDCLLIAPSKQGKTVALVIAIIQKLEIQIQDSIATRALLVVKDKEAVLELIALFQRLNIKNDLRIYGVHEKSDLDTDKNKLSLGNDVLIGTATRLNELFVSAGFDVNQLEIYAIDDLDIQLKNRLELPLHRFSQSIGKTQHLYLATIYNERAANFIDKTMNEEVRIFDFTQEKEG